ncbi:MAG: complex I NDUFA9 subunit family protein [Gammaproteobacteria bacterium]
MLIRKICILGGTGFVGRVLSNRLVREGIKLRILTRNRERNKDDLILLPGTELIETDVHNPDNLKQQFAGCDAVINLVGILNERGRKGRGFQHVHVELARKVVESCAANGIRRLLHMSALNADDVRGPSHYLKTKGKAEDFVFASSAQGINVTGFRPSVIFGTHDSFFNRFAALLRLTWVFPLACYGARFAPVHVADVAEAFVRTLKDPASYGRRYHLCGPHVYTLEELVRYTARCIGVKRWIIPLNDTLSRVQAAVFDFVPGKPFSTDNYLSAQVDSVCAHNDFAELGITPVAIETVVPQYLSHRIQRARYYQFRSRSHRNSAA